DAEKILEFDPDGIIVSNGPGDPIKAEYVIKTLKNLFYEKIPIFGICLGHQIIALALGAKTYKLKFGHHGSNHPVKDLETGKCYITSQNHNFAVDEESCKEANIKITHINLNDNSVEGISYTDKNLKIFSVQYHPEAHPGPHDSYYLFDKFAEEIRK
ncbi:MAG: carbamoyl phosphate synthase small subunit, partial [Candidatus Altarchaeaceae archaeon]